MRRLAIGQILSSHGVKGYLKIRSFSGEFGHFKKLKAVNLDATNDEAKYLVESVIVRHSAVLLKFKGIDNPEDAKTLAGRKIWVDRRFAVPLASDEYYAVDLQGCDVYHQNTIIGRVVTVFDASGLDLIEIKRTNGASFVMPFNDHFIGDVTLEENKLEIREDGVDS